MFVPCGCGKAAAEYMYLLALKPQKPNVSYFRNANSYDDHGSLNSWLQFWPLYFLQIQLLSLIKRTKFVPIKQYLRIKTIECQQGFDVIKEIPGLQSALTALVGLGIAATAAMELLSSVGKFPSVSHFLESPLWSLYWKTTYGVRSLLIRSIRQSVK